VLTIVGSGRPLLNQRDPILAIGKSASRSAAETWRARRRSATLGRVTTLAHQHGGVEVLRYAAFTVDGKGGNPAGVVLDAGSLSPPDMQEIARVVGFSETAFLSPASSPGHRVVRYFSPRAEVAFCGHATVAAAVAHAERAGELGDLLLESRVGVVPVRISSGQEGITATLTSVATSVRSVPGDELEGALAALRWRPDDLDEGWPPMIGNAGNDHLVLVAKQRERLRDLDYDFALLDRLMERTGWTTVHLTWPERADYFHARDPFPPGGVVEDPATGAAAAAFGAYLRHLGRVPRDGTVEIRQGEAMGRPSRLVVTIPPGGDAGVHVSGTAAPMA
jgi:PhzF family phenazine biosynthesis protein